MTYSRGFILIALLIWVVPASASGGFTNELFEAWLSMRAGGGKTSVYWYSEGLIRSFPDGKVTAKMEGFDTAHLIPDPEDPNTFYQLSRKIFLFVDPDTGKILDRDPIAYPYQLKTYTLDGEHIVYTVESHNGRINYTLGPMRNYSVKMIGDVIWFNYAVFIPRGVGKFENSDFFVQPEGSMTEEERYQQSWVSYGPGPTTSSAVAWRYTEFDAMPERIKTFVRERAPLWLIPPRDRVEIAQIRKNFSSTLQTE